MWGCRGVIGDVRWKLGELRGGLWGKWSEKGDVGEDGGEVRMCLECGWDVNEGVGEEEKRGGKWVRWENG